MYVDSTGLGMPVVELIGEVLRDHEETADVSVWGTSFIYGQRGYDRERGTVGKTWLFRRLYSLLTMGRLDLPARDPMTPVLRAEIDAFRFEVDRNGVESMGGQAPEHDDILCALALACMVEPVSFWSGRSIKFSAPGY